MIDPQISFSVPAKVQHVAQPVDLRLHQHLDLSVFTFHFCGEHMDQDTLDIMAVFQDDIFSALHINPKINLCHGKSRLCKCKF